MDTKLFKSFTPVINTATDRTAVQHVFDNLESMEAEDPKGSQWRHGGFIRPIEGDDFLISMDGRGWLACVQINERNLPGAVIREKVLEKALALADSTGRKPGKKEVAQLRDEVELELLPKAFIKRKLVPIMFVGKRVYVFSSSAKVVDDVLTLLMRSAEMDDMFQPQRLDAMVEKNIGSELTYLANVGQSETTDSEGEFDINYLQITNAAVLKGANKQKITVSDKDIGSADLSDLLKQDYTVVKLGLGHVLAGNTDADSTFILNDKLVFSRFIADGVKNVKGKSKEDAEATFIGTAWLVANAVDSAVDTVINVMGGLRVSVKTTIDKPTTLEGAEESDDEDDEL